MQTILFLCTGNYYRSRYAELLFNELAQRAGLGWRAASRGLFVKEGVNPGPIAKPTLTALADAGIVPPAADIERYPAQVSEAELAGAAIVVALKEAEHRPLLAASYPGWKDRVIYWHIHDLDKASPAEALGEIDRLVREVVAELATDSEPMTNGR
ncbi:MAG: low molecular weight phosphatase family protein [Chloroflexi bacterium]|nr:MAG: low molecular weight phosphatase family protein [Chloroflexota bacterium]